MYMDNNNLSGLVDEAHLDPEWIFPGEDDKGMVIELPHPTSIMTLAVAIYTFVDNEELHKELMCGYEYSSNKYSDSVRLYWPSLDCTDWLRKSA